MATTANGDQVPGIAPGYRPGGAERHQGIGAIALGGEWWPVYCLSGELRLLPQPPDNRGSVHYWIMAWIASVLLCDQVETLAETPPAGAAGLHGVARFPIQALAPLDEGWVA